MSRKTPDTPDSLPDRLSEDLAGFQAVEPAEAGHGWDVATPQPARVPKPGAPPSEEEQIESGFDNMPV
jgi:hypothetical protein